MTLNENEYKNRQTLISWIVSLAVSIALCASFFLDVKSQLLDAKNAHALDAIKMEMLDQRITRLNNDLSDLHRSLQPTANAQHPVVDVTPQPASQPIPDTPINNSNGVNVFRGQLPANATINAQPPAGDAVVPTTPPTDVPNIQPPKMALPSSPDASPASSPTFAPKP